jgi:aminoglycoside 2'-N-acetyltransferase I
MDERLEIFGVAEADPELEKQLRDWFRDEFGRVRYQWAEPDYYAILRRDEKLAGRLAIFDRQVSAGDVTVRVGGIGGVATKPNLRHRGVASALLSRAADFMKRQLGVEFGLLLCQPAVSPVYAKLGWSRVEGPTTFAQPGGAVRYPYLTMVLPLAGKAWPPGPIDMLGLPW